MSHFESMILFDVSVFYQIWRKIIFQSAKMNLRLNFFPF